MVGRRPREQQGQRPAHAYSHRRWQTLHPWRSQDEKSRRTVRLTPQAVEALRQHLRSQIHTCASLLFQKNVHPKFVQELLGHASVAITLDTYSHLLPGMGGEAADAIEEVLGRD